MTVTKAIAAAGRLETSGGWSVNLFRDKGSFLKLPAPYRVRSANTTQDVVSIRMKHVMDGKAPDLAVQPGDIISVLDLL
jgi:hypothetical protein